MAEPGREAGQAAGAGPGRQAIVVLGMHRSGTSALAGMLARLGCAPPRSPIVGANNPLGYFESTAVRDLNERILAQAGTGWADWTPIDPAWQATEAGRALAAEARATLEAEFGAAPLLVLKDPRICRLAPFWFEALERTGCRPLVVLTHRHPLEVAASLARRNRFDAGFSLLLWLGHVLEAERASRGRPRAFTSYDRLMGEWRGVAARLEDTLGLAFPRRAAAEAEIDALLKRDLRHHDHGSAGPGDLPAWVASAHAALEAAAAGGGEPDAARLDALAAALAAALPLFAPPLAAARAAAAAAAARGARLERLEAARRAAEERQATLADRARTAAEALAAARRENATLKRALERQTREVHAQRGLIEGLRAESADRRAALDAIGARLERLEAGLEDRRALETLREALARAEAERFEETAHLTARVQAAEAEAARLGAERARLEAEAKAAVEAATAARAAAEAALARARAEHAAALQRLEILRALERSAARRHEERWPARARAALRGLGARIGHGLGLGALARDARLLAQSDLFDPDWYRRTYPDVAAAGVDPARHYLECGAREGRQPSPAFDGIEYYRQNPDVLRAGTNPLVHYLRRGAAAARRPAPVQTAQP